MRQVSVGKRLGWNVGAGQRVLECIDQRWYSCPRSKHRKSLRKSHLAVAGCGGKLIFQDRHSEARIGCKNLNKWNPFPELRSPFAREQAFLPGAQWAAIQLFNECPHFGLTPWLILNRAGEHVRKDCTDLSETLLNLFEINVARRDFVSNGKSCCDSDRTAQILHVRLITKIK